MRVIDTSQLSSGLVLAEDLLLENQIVVPRNKVLTDDDVYMIRKNFQKCKILSLKELQPLIYNSSSFSRSYIDFLVRQFNLIFSSVFNNSSEFKQLSLRISNELLRNRAVLIALLHLRQKHEYTYNHSTNVALLSVEVGCCLQLSDLEIHSLILGALLHDIGKLEISNKILDKPAKLTDTEFEQVKKHPQLGFSLTERLDSMNPDIMRIVKEHHEKMDGSGYPQHLQGNDICPLSRIVTVCDMYDAITSKRSYHEAFSYERGAEILRQDAKSHKLDSVLVQTLLSNVVVYTLDMYVRLSNGVSGFVVAEDRQNNRPVIYDCVYKKFYDLKKLLNVYIVYAI